MKQLGWDKLVEFGTRLLRQKGLAAPNARYIAETAVKTEAFGVHTHGLAILCHLEKSLGTTVDAAAEPVIVTEKGATALLDGCDGPGPLTIRLAAEIALEKALTYGVAMIAGRNCSWIGALGIYLMPLVEKGLIAQLSVQTSGCADCAPFGGIDAVFSTNPVAMAFPTDGDPVIADISTSAVSMGRTQQMIRDNRKASSPVFMDDDGHLSDDPSVVSAGGTILFLGGEAQGHKGYALSLWVEALAAAAGGDCSDPNANIRQTFNLTAIDPDAFNDREYYLNEMNRLLKRIKSSRIRPGVNAIRLPGEHGYRCLREALGKGVSVEDHMIERLEQIAAANGLPGLR